MTSDFVALLFSGLLVFLTGLFMLFTYRNLLRIVLAVEVLAKGVTLIILAAGVYRHALALTQSLLVTFIIVETVLAAVLLAIIVICQRTNGSLDIRSLAKLKG
jgi:NADH:ubiquinone oxidoreductase subunit K